MRCFVQNVTLIIFMVTLFIANFASAAQSKIGILVYDGFLTSDVTAPIEVFGAATKKSWFSSYQVIVISTTKNKTLRSEEGLRIIVDKSIYDEVELDVLIVPSAYNMDAHLNDKNLIEFIAKHKDTASWIASNCSGALLLAEAGVLDGKKATTWAGGEGELLKLYPKVDVQFNQNVVVDGNVITSNGGPVSYQAAFELLARLSSEGFAKEIRESLQFNRLDRVFDKKSK